MLAIAVGLAMDAFAVSIAAGLKLSRVGPRHVFRLSFHFGLFQFMMPIIGWTVGSTFSSRIAAYDHWLAFCLLSFIGSKMLVDGLMGKERRGRSDPTRGWSLVGLSLATSIDALAVGLSLAFLGISILLPCLVIGVVAALFSTLGVIFGNRILRSWGPAAEMLGGGVLMVIGIRILLSGTL